MNTTIEVNLEPILDIRHVEKLHNALDAALAEKKSVLLLADKVEKIDTAAMQILLSFIQQAKKQSIGVTWNTPSKVLYDYAQLLGIHQALQL